MKGRVRRLLYGDNLHILPTIPAGSIDLVVMDPPFNKNDVFSGIVEGREVPWKDMLGPRQRVLESWRDTLLDGRPDIYVAVSYTHLTLPTIPLV